MGTTGRVRAQPLIAVRDVVASSRWYAQLLGLRPLGESLEETHGNVYNRLYAGDDLVLQLHSWDDEEHPNLVGEGQAKNGHGVLVWFEVDDFEGACDRASTLGAEVVVQPHVNEGPKHREVWIRDLDGYMVVLASQDGEATR